MESNFTSSIEAPPKKVLISHISNTLNYGSAMMAISLILGIKKRLGSRVDIYCDCDELNLKRLIVGTGEPGLIECPFEIKPKEEHWITRAYKLFMHKNEWDAKVAEYFDCLIVLGGDDLSEVYMKNAIIKGWHYSYINRNCQIILAGQSIGPYTGLYKFLAQYIFRKILIITRDDRSYHFLTKKLFLSSAYKGRDLAINDLPVISNIVKNELSAIEKVDYITVVPSGLSAKYTNDQSGYVQVWEHILEIIKEKNPTFKIVLLAHVLKPDRVSDVNIINQLLSRTSLESKEIFSFIEPMQPVEARKILAGSKYVVTGRMHAAVSALYMGKPAISLAYSEKYFGVISEGLGLDDLVIDCRNKTWCDNSPMLLEMSEKIDIVNTSYDSLCKQIRKKILENKIMVEKELDFIVRAISGNNND